MQISRMIGASPYPEHSNHFWAGTSRINTENISIGSSMKCSIDCKAKIVAGFRSVMLPAATVILDKVIVMLSHVEHGEGLSVRTSISLFRLKFLLLSLFSHESAFLGSKYIIVTVFIARVCLLQKFVPYDFLM